MSGGVAPERSGPFLLAKVTRELAGQWGSVKRPLLKHSFQRKRILVGLPFYCWKLCSRISVRFWWRWLDLEARWSGSWCYSTHGMQHTTLKTICPVSRCHFCLKKNNQDQKLNSFLPTRFVAGIHGQMWDRSLSFILSWSCANVCFSLSYQSWHVMQILVLRSDHSLIFWLLFTYLLFVSPSLGFILKLVCLLKNLESIVI